MNGGLIVFKRTLLSVLLLCAGFQTSLVWAKYITCKVAIVGGGAAGVHTFFRLAPIYKDENNKEDYKFGVCLFEKNDYFGGRIKDISFPERGKWAAGAVRVMEGQTVLFNLAEELGIELQAADYEEQRVFARGVYHSDTNDFLGRRGPYQTVKIPNYRELNCRDPKVNYPGCYNDSYYQHLFTAKRAATLVPGDSTIEEYAPTVLGSNRLRGAEPFQFLKDTFRFRGDFLSEVDARSYIDFLREDWDACCTPSYPIGGMSAFIEGMLAKAQSNGARAFSSQPVTEINKWGSDKYILKTPDYTVMADKVVIAVPPVAFKKISGTIANRIKQTPQFQAIQPIRVITVEQWWDSPWWDSTTDRGWATPERGFMFNFIEMPHSDYQKMQVATRSVYDDDPRTVQFWADTYYNAVSSAKAAGEDEEQAKQAGNNAINKAIVKQLQKFFQNPSISTSNILQTYFQDWPDAWYWLRKNTHFTNADIAIWAVKPLENEAVSLASDAYNPNRTTWSDGAYKSSINTLNQNFGLNLDCASVIPDGNGGLKYVPFQSEEFYCP